MRRVRNSYLDWLRQHLAQIKSRPTNGRKSISDIDTMLLEIKGNRRRVDRNACIMLEDTVTAKALILEANDALELSNT